MRYLTCPVCGMQFKAYGKVKRTYCSRACMAKGYDLGLNRFWNFVDRGDPNQCWPWTGWFFARNPYGGFTYGGKTYRAHRLAYTLTNGPVPSDKVVLHTCDNPACCNPAHLVVGTYRENTQDMLHKKRHITPCGERHPHAKLTDDDVRRIRELAGNGLTHRAIADMFGVAQAQIWRVVRGKSWKHVL